MEFGQKPDSSRRLIGVGLVIALHALVVWGLVSGLARKAIELLPAPIETKILEETAQVDEPPPPPPPPDFDVPPPPFIPPPEINIAQQAPRPTAITTVTNTPAPTPAPPAPRPTGVTVKPVVKAKNCREPDYPAVSERLGEAGSVVLQLLVGVDGKVTDSKIESSSGYERLDKAAQAALSRCRFTPGTVDGAPAPGWAQLKYTFKPSK
jgi:protein TonB